MASIQTEDLDIDCDDAGPRGAPVVVCRRAVEAIVRELKRDFPRV
jgi:hypothetical protein